MRASDQQLLRESGTRWEGGWSDLQSSENVKAKHRTRLWKIPFEMSETAMAVGLDYVRRA